MLTSRLPRGIAFVYVRTAFGRLAISSDRLTAEERRVASIAASARALSGAYALVLTVSEIARILEEVARL